MKASTRRLLPLKTDVYVYAVYNSPFTIDEMIESLSETHGSEGQFTLRVIEKYLLAYCGVSILGPDLNIVEGDAGKLRFTITEYGKQLIKYLPLDGMK